VTSVVPTGLYSGPLGRVDRGVLEAERILYEEAGGGTDVWTPTRVEEFWRAEIRARLRRDKDVVFLTWGGPGSGKSTADLYLMSLIDETFTPATLPDRIAFRPGHVPRLYEKTPRYGCASIDEAVSSGLMATDHFSREQKELVELINLIRAKNVALFIAIPDAGDLAKSFRARRADYRMDIEETPKGPVGWVGRRVRGRKFFLDDGSWLGFSDDKDANPFTWPNLRENPDMRLRALWDAYRPLKEFYMNQRIGELSQRMNAKSRSPKHNDRFDDEE